MIEDLKPYPQYKDSVLPWLGEVPAHWGIARGRQIFEVRKRIAGTLGYPVLSITQQGLRVKDVTRGEGQLSQDYSKYQLVKPGEFAMNAMDLITGGVGIAAHEGVTSPDYRVFAIRNEEQHNSRFYLLLLRMLYANLAFYSCGQGSAQLGRWRLPRKRFNDFFFPTPPASEQAAIARFLAWATNRLDRAIGAKRRIIALLQEQKQAIIHRAVTRGLDPAVPLKDSGIPWLGEIPAHWEVRRLKDVATVQTGITLGKDYGLVSTTLYPYLRVANVQSDRLDLRNVKYVAVPEVEAKRSSLISGDVLMTEGGDIDKLGRGCLWSGEVASCLHQNHVFAVRCGEDLIPGFLVALMGSAHGRSYFQITAKQTTNLASTNSTTLKGFPLLLPECQEQRQILSFIDGETGHLRRAITDTDREITLLREYRTRLIADVVTGKLDVREVSAGLPEEELQDQLDASAGYDADEAEDDAKFDLIDTAED
jgi:type I restriction enzyme S subunit